MYWGDSLSSLARVWASSLSYRYGSYQEKDECRCDLQKAEHNLCPDCLLPLNCIFSSFTACMSKYSAGCIYYYPSFHRSHNPAQAEKLQKDLKRYLTRKIGFEAVMRIRCTKGLFSVPLFTAKLALDVLTTIWNVLRLQEHYNLTEDAESCLACVCYVSSLWVDVYFKGVCNSV